MSWLVYPKNPTEEYLRVWREDFGRKNLSDDGAMWFPVAYFYRLSEFLGDHGLNFTGHKREGDGALFVDLSDELCKKIADYLEANGPFTAEQLPPEWRDMAERQSKDLIRLIPIFRYSGGIFGNN